MFRSFFPFIPSNSADRVPKKRPDLKSTEEKDIGWTSTTVETKREGSGIIILIICMKQKYIIYKQFLGRLWFFLGTEVV